MNSILNHDKKVFMDFSLKTFHMYKSMPFHKPFNDPIINWIKY